LVNAEYQEFITGYPVGNVYRVGNVNFDGYNEATGTLLDAKGNYSGVIERLPRFMDRYFLKTATKQLGAAGDTPIAWHFAQPDAAEYVKALFLENDIDISVYFTPRIVSTPPGYLT
jgi:Restriction endonuclease fold toxin 5